MNLAASIMFFIWVSIVLFVMSAWALKSTFEQLELELDLEIDDDEDQFESSDLL